jgi:hypothetical protein
MNLRLLVLSFVLASVAVAAPPKKGPAWRVFVEPGGSYKISYPPGWQVLTKGSAVVITSPGGPEERGVFGITLRGEGSTIQDSVKKEFDDPDRSSDLQQSPAKLADNPAIKVWGSKKGDASIRIVEYYVQRGDRQYYILFQAPHDAMSRYSQHFNAMIGSMKFLQ